MSTPPRRRRPNSPNANGEGGGWLPTIAMGLGVVVAGLGIGALVAVLMQRSSGKLAPLSGTVAVATSPASPAKPLPRPPVVIATIAPPHSYLSPSAVPSPEPSESPSASEAASPQTSASPVPSASATARQTAAPRPDPSRLVAAVAVPLANAAPVAGGAAAQPRISRLPSAEPTVAATAQATAELATAAPSVSTGPTTIAAAPVTAAAESAYDEHAAAVVRRYVDALIRGDDKTAYSALGGTGGTLSEQSFIDPSAHIVSLKVTRIDASNASVGCEIASVKGHYYATFHVTAASSGPYISEHDYIKV